jgi:large subunit ribosomal protein L6
MSRIAKYPVAVPDKVQVTVDKGEVTVKGPLGTLKQIDRPPGGGQARGQPGHVRRRGREPGGQRHVRTLRATVANMVSGVKDGFQKKLTLVGVGYRAQAQGSKLNLSLGFSHPIVYALPEGVKAETPTQTEIVIKGVDRQKVGQVAAEVRAYKPPEPYKGKGVRYADEKVVIKETKKK